MFPGDFNFVLQKSNMCVILPIRSLRPLAILVLPFTEHRTKGKIYVGETTIVILLFNEC